MKTQIKRFSKSTLAVVLTICMLISCMTVGIIATDAAKMNSESVGDATYYLRGNIKGTDYWNSNSLVMTQSGDCYYYVIDMYNNDQFKFFDGSTWHGPSSETSVTADSDSKTGKSGGNGNFKLNGNNGVYVIWYKPSSEKVWVVSTTLYVDGYINGADKTGTGGFLMTQNASDATLYEANITTTTDTQYLAIYGATSGRYYNFGNGTLAADTWSGDYNNTNTSLDYDKIATSGGASGQTIKVSFSTRDRHIHWTVASQSYYLHYAENDSGMSGATVQQMTDNEDGTYSYTVSGWDKTKMNMLVNTSSTNVTGTGSSTSLTVTADTGLSVDKSTPGENSGYYRMQFSLSSTPQNITFTFNSNTGVLNAAGSLTRYAITAGGDSTGAAGGYKLKVSDGSTTINNYGGTATANFVQNKTLTVTVTPDVNTQKVTAISGCSSVTDNGNGTYSGTFTVSAEATVTATLATKSNYTVTFSAGANGSVSATANGETLTSSATVLEGTKVTFNAAADDGYVFSGWSGGFTDTISTVTKTITANTTVTANFAKQGYKIVYQGAYGSDGKSMTEMSNGKYISSVTVDNGWYFRIADTGKSKISKGSGTPQKLSANKEYKVTGWEPTPQSWNNANSFSNNTGAAAYVVYDPVADKVYLTSERDGLFSSYDVYIKDGTVRYMDNSWGGFSSDYGTTTLESTGTTAEVTASTITDKYASHVKKITLTAEQVRSGVDLHIKTAVNSTYQSSYYVTGFDVNGGLTQGLISQEFDSEGNQIAAGSYSDAAVGAKIHTNHYNDFTLKLTAEKFPDGIIEVTPIYFPICAKEDDFVRFYAYDFTEDVKKDWGGALAVYPYIENKYDPYGKYPGQLMVNIDGSYYADIPATYMDGETELKIQGLTMNNYVWDALHYDLFYGSDQSGNNWQTYDYNEFAVINELLRQSGQEGEDIIFSFKYKATKTRAASNLGESTYYVDSDTNDPSNSKDYRNGYQSIDVEDSQYHWEDLTDFYGNKVDIFGERIEQAGNETKMAYNPIRIVSNGYDDNKVGYYATAWALYKPVNASGANAWTGTVDHYELFDVIGGQGRKDRDYESESFLINPEQTTYRRVRMKYNEAFHNAHLNEEGYPQSTLILDASLVPVQITYEYNVQADKSNINTGPSQQAYRSDGRWYYSDSTQLIKANTIVEVANSKAGPFVRDYFQENNYDYKSGENYIPTKNAGLNTGVKAYLTNSNSVRKNDVDYQNVSGNTQAYAISDGESVNDYHFKAEEDPDGNYTFVGWYRLTESGAGVGYTLASEDMEFSTEAKTNDVYVARFVKVPAGTLNISHSLTSDSRGAADCYAKAEILDNSDTVIDSTTYGYTTGTIKISSKYIKYAASDSNKIRITLKTELGANTNFEEFRKKVEDVISTLSTNDNLGINATVAFGTVDGHNIATITFSISDLFTTTDGETTQTVKTLPFYSKTYLPEYKYEITYNFGSRKLIQNGKLSDNRLWGNQFYKYKGTFTAEEVDQYLDLSGTPTFKSAETANYLAEHSPYEKNFLEDIVWDFSNKTIAYDPETLTFSCSLTASQSTNTTITATFKLPFDYTLNTTTANAYTFSADNVYKDPALVVQHESVNMDFLDWFSLNDVKNKTQMTAEKQPEFLKVPDVLYDTTHTKKRTFMYWEFYKEGDTIGTSAPYQKCYSSALNQAVYQNTIFYPKYTDELEMSAQEIKYVADAKSATITFLGVTRDQWNYNGGGADAYAIWGSKFADRIFTDFVMSFQYENKLIDSLGTNYKTGLIIQTLDPSGAIASETPEKLAAKYASNDGKENAIAKIKATDADISETGVNKYLISYNQQPLDDRNAIEYYYGIANVSQSTNPEKDTFTNVTTRRNYGYRAYSFIKKGTGTNAEVIISDPVYFTIYDVASITSGAALITP